MAKWPRRNKVKATLARVPYTEKVTCSPMESTSPQAYWQLCLKVYRDIYLSAYPNIYLNIYLNTGDRTHCATSCV